MHSPSLPYHIHWLELLQLLGRDFDHLFAQVFFEQRGRKRRGNRNILLIGLSIRAYSLLNQLRYVRGDDKLVL